MSLVVARSPIPHLPFLFISALTLSACDLPRSAGLQSEILSTGAGADALPPDVAVMEVTRATLAGIDGWPVIGAPERSWLRHREQPAALLIAPGDQLRVMVWDAAETSLIAAPGQRAVPLQEVQVSASGEVFLPFVGKLAVAGLSAETARTRIEEHYATVIPAAQIQLAVDPGRANTANLVSGVVAPGLYPLPDRNVTLLGLLSMGGGVDPALPNPQIRLFRGQQVFGIALSRLYEDPALDTVLSGGDRVIVEADTRTFLSLGAAGLQSRHGFPAEQISALDALSVIGGVDGSRANPRGVLILRDYPRAMVQGALQAGDRPPHPRMIFTIDLTSAEGLFSAGRFRIMPGDLIYVTESPVGAARTVMGLIGSAVGLGNQL